MAIPRRERILRVLYSLDAWDLYIAVFTLIGGIRLTLDLLQQNFISALMVGLSAGGVFGCTVVKKIVMIYKSVDEPLHALEGCLEILHSVLLPEGDYLPQDEPGLKLRLTVHVPVNNGSELEQVLNYVGDDSGSRTVGRRFSSNCGIIGAAFRENDVFWASRESDHYNSFIEELVAEWGYIREDAQKLNPGTYSWFAMPLSGEDDSDVIGILYIDANHKNFFDDEWIREIIMLSAAGIVRFVKRRFPK